MEQKSSLIQLQNRLDMSLKKIYDGKCFSCPLELQINKPALFKENIKRDNNNFIINTNIINDKK